MIDKILIAIPSKARYDRIMKYTAGWLTGSNLNWKVFIEPREIPFYKQVLEPSHLASIGENDKGMHFVLNKIGDYARRHGYRYIFKIDDDCKGFDLYPNNDPINNIIYIIHDIVQEFEKDPKLGGVRFIQKRFWLYRKKETKRFSHRNKPLWGISIYRTEAYPQLPSEINHFDDTIHSLMMWAKGWETMTYCNAGCDVLQNAGKGGHYSFDRQQMAYNAIKHVKDNMFPKVGFKDNSNPGIKYDIDISAYDKGYCV